MVNWAGVLLIRINIFILESTVDTGREEASIPKRFYQVGRDPIGRLP